MKPFTELERITIQRSLDNPESNSPSDHDTDVALPLFRRPRITDATSVSAMVRESGVLEENSCYAYLLLFRDFAETCVMAEIEGEPAGFIVGYRPPARSDTVFVWQIGVGRAFRRRGLARKMLTHLTDRLAADGVSFVEATITPSNEASLRMFESFAHTRGARFAYQDGFRADDFGSASHEPELLIRIGPLPANDSISR